MSKRLQVLLEETELLEIQRIAKQNGMTVAEWVRQALRAARQRLPAMETMKKLETVRAAAQHEYPTADIDRMLAEIEHGRGGEEAS